MKKQKLITIAEIVEKYKISRQTIMRRVKKGYIAPYKIPGDRRLFFERDEVENLLRPHKISNQ